eukprot:10041322-Alexandrium_andersonii.AAC.1
MQLRTALEELPSPCPCTDLELPFVQSPELPSTCPHVALALPFALASNCPQGAPRTALCDPGDGLRRLKQTTRSGTVPLDNTDSMSDMHLDGGCGRIQPSGHTSPVWGFGSIR